MWAEPQRSCWCNLNGVHAELQEVLLVLQENHKVCGSWGASPGLACVSVPQRPDWSDQSSGRRLIHGQVSERNFLFLRREGVVVERAVHRPERERESVSWSSGAQVFCTCPGDLSPTCRAADVRGTWPNAAASVCDAAARDDVPSPSDRTTAGCRRESSVCPAELLPLRPDL